MDDIFVRRSDGSLIFTVDDIVGVTGNSYLVVAPKHVASRPAGVAQVLLAVLARWNIPDNQGSTILGSDDPNFVLHLRLGGASLATRDMRDRARLLFDVYEGVYGLLEAPQSEREWIRTPRADFEGRSLLDLMTEGSQRNLIRALTFVDYINGR